VTLERRIPRQKVQLVGRDPGDYAFEAQQAINDLIVASDEGQPAGFTDTLPETITPDSAGDAGTAGLGWAAADHDHPIATGTASALANAAGEGSSTSFSRADHAHKRDVRVKLEGSDIGTRNCLNFLDSSTVNITATDDSGNDEVEITAVVIGVPAATPIWTKYTVTHTALQAAAMANDIALFSLVAGGIIEGVKIKHSVIFAGTGITDYKISVGIVGNLTKYASAFDVDTAVAATNFQLSTTVGSEDHGSATSIRIAATSTGANLNQSTGGSVDIWVKTSVAV
jgi:hypothetical protein